MIRLGPRPGATEAKAGPYDVDEERRAANKDLAIKVTTFLVFVGLINMGPKIVKSLSQTF